MKKGFIFLLLLGLIGPVTFACAEETDKVVGDQVAEEIVEIVKEVELPEEAYGFKDPCADVECGSCCCDPCSDEKDGVVESGEEAYREPVEDLPANDVVVADLDEPLEPVDEGVAAEDEPTVPVEDVEGTTDAEAKPGVPTPTVQPIIVPRPPMFYGDPWEFISDELLLGPGYASTFLFPVKGLGGLIGMGIAGGVIETSDGKPFIGLRSWSGGVCWI